MTLPPKELSRALDVPSLSSFCFINNWLGSASSFCEHGGFPLFIIMHHAHVADESIVKDSTDREWRSESDWFSEYICQRGSKTA